MSQVQVEFIACAFSQRDLPESKAPEVALAGRSNVGKSSLINRLVGKKGIARTSSAPGKTRSINFYRCCSSFLLVDLPGFGYTGGKDGSRAWQKLVEHYFTGRPAVALVIHLVDSRMPPTALDIRFAEWLDQFEIPRLVVATKADKLSGNQRVVQLRAIRETFPEAPVIFASAVSGMGCKEIWNRVVEATQNH